MRWLKSKNSRSVLSKEELFLFYLSRLLLVEVNHARHIMTGIPTQTTDWLSCRGFCFVSHQTSVMGIRTALNSNHGKYEQAILSLISWQTPSRMRRICFHWELVIKLWRSHQRKKEKKTNSPIVLPNVASTLKKNKVAQNVLVWFIKWLFRTLHTAFYWPDKSTTLRDGVKTDVPLSGSMQRFLVPPHDSGRSAARTNIWWRCQTLSLTHIRLCPIKWGGTMPP